MITLEVKKILSIVMIVGYVLMFFGGARYLLNSGAFSGDSFSFMARIENRADGKMVFLLGLGICAMGQIMKNTVKKKDDNKDSSNADNGD